MSESGWLSQTTWTASAPSSRQSCTSLPFRPLSISAQKLPTASTLKPFPSTISAMLVKAVPLRQRLFGRPQLEQLPQLKLKFEFVTKWKNVCSVFFFFFCVHLIFTLLPFVASSSPFWSRTSSIVAAWPLLFFCQ